VFTPDWMFGGKRYGWGLRFRKSKSFCTLIPERGRPVVQIVFGREERQEAEAILPELTAAVRNAYSGATTFHDGKWVATILSSDEVLADIERLLALKRKPRQRDGDET
jgi:hypothetical protein